MRWATLALASTFLGLLAANDVFAAEKMNVLFIIADDQNCQLGCYGNTVIKTPNIDRLASSGIRFDRAYVNYPVCNPSRTSFLSGRRPDTTGVFGNATSMRIKLGDDYQFMPEYFKSHGYYTAGIGKVAHGAFAGDMKWDVQMDPQTGDDEDAPGNRAGRKRQQKQAAKNAQDVSVPFDWYASDNDDAEEPDGITVRKIAKLLEEHKDGPFFIAAGLHKPHVPHGAPKKYFDMYPPDRMLLPTEPSGHTSSIPEIAHPNKYFPDLTGEQSRNIISHYLAASTFMDTQLGILLDTMDRLKLWDNTIVVFIGDHGWHFGEHGGFWAKSSLMQESAGAPLIVRAPGKANGTTCARIVEFIDLFPTLTEFCGLPAQEGLEGASFMPLLSDPKRKGKEAAYSVVTRSEKGRKNVLGRSVHTERWTYIAWPDGSEQLYDYAADPKEYNNLAGDSQHTPVLAEMKALLHKVPHSMELSK
ncbi:MAG TPA: sulfatase [Pirellulales bacterium]|nr:sulfatase [Pirellulales bacterium]